MRRLCQLPLSRKRLQERFTLGISPGHVKPLFMRLAIPPISAISFDKVAPRDRSTNCGSAPIGSLTHRKSKHLRLRTPTKPSRRVAILPHRSTFSLVLRNRGVHRPQPMIKVEKRFNKVERTNLEVLTPSYAWSRNRSRSRIAGFLMLGGFA